MKMMMKEMQVWLAWKVRRTVKKRMCQLHPVVLPDQMTVMSLVST